MLFYLQKATEIKEQLSSLLEGTDSDIIRKRANVKAIPTPSTTPPATVAEVDEALRSFHLEIDASYKKFSDILAASGTKPAPAPQQRRAQETTPARQRARPAAPVSPEAAEAALSSSYEAESGEDSFSVMPAWSALYERTEDLNQAISLLMESLRQPEAPAETSRPISGFVFSLCALSDDLLVACTCGGVLRLNGDGSVAGVWLAGEHFAVTRVGAHRVLTIEDDAFSVYRFGIDRAGDRIWHQSLGGAVVRSVGALPGSMLYLFATEGRVLIWSEGHRQWLPDINLEDLMANPYGGGFELIAVACRSFLSVHLAGAIICLGDFGIDGKYETLWINEFACERPNGLTWDNGLLFVCDGDRNGASITILNADCGEVLRRVLTDGWQFRPWSVAVSGDKIAVVDRYYRHNTNRSAMRIRTAPIQFTYSQ